MENLYKVGGSLKSLAKAKEFLWQGRVEPTLDLFKYCRKKNAKNGVAELGYDEVVVRVPKNNTH